MKRALFLSILLTLPIILILTLLTVEESRPKAWQIELDKYMVYREAVVSDTLKTKLVDTGTMPWHFNRIMSKAAFGENPHFETDYGYDGKIIESGSTALPYPPQSLWCALITNDPNMGDSPSTGQSYSVVIIAEHREHDNIATVVHELSSDHIPLAQSLGIVGCKKVMEEIQFEEAGVWT